MALYVVLLTLAYATISQAMQISRPNCTVGLILPRGWHEGSDSYITKFWQTVDDKSVIAYTSAKKARKQRVSKIIAKQ